MVRRNGGSETLPTAEDLAGVPPVLEDDQAEVVGEADEAAPALVGVELDKGAQSSDWGRVDELTESQLSYAANDVRYLLPAREQLEV